MALPTAMIFRKSVDTSRVKQDWRMANITQYLRKAKDRKLKIIDLLA